MTILQFSEGLKIRAEQIIHGKSTLDDMKAGLNITKVYDVILALKNKEIGSVERAETLHKKLLDEYTTIYILDNAYQKRYDALPKNPEFINKPQMSQYEILSQKLHFDAFGIFADVLMKHKITKTVDEIIESVREGE